MNRINFITQNQRKVEEFRAKAEPFRVKINHIDASYPELQADTLEEVVNYALAYCRTTFPPPFIIEDSGLFIDRLHGFPGPYSSYVYKTIGIDGLLKLAEEGTPARFESVIGCYYYGDIMLFTGSVEGAIVNPRGSGGFGFDPIFEYERRTFGEMTIDEKSAYSHRGKSTERLVKWASTII